MSVNVNTIARPEGVTISEDDVVVDPQTQQVMLREGAVEEAMAKGVEIDVGVSAPMRAGLEVSFHLGKTVDFNLYGALSSLGGGFSGEKVKTVGGALVIRWDDIVPAVLPKESREESESCEATERRFRACPLSRHWLSPEQRGQAAPESAAPATPPSAPAPTVAPAPAQPPAVAPAPAAPAPAPAAPPSAPGSGSFPAQ